MKRYDVVATRVDVVSGEVEIQVTDTSDNQTPARVCYAKIYPWDVGSFSDLLHTLHGHDWAAEGSVNIFASFTDAWGLVGMAGKPTEFHHLDFVSGEWIADVNAAWEFVREKRSSKLQKCDWTQLPDVPIATKDAWAVYRQALRDITEQPDPFNIVWPTPPA